MIEKNLSNRNKIVIAHRGASGYRPEHTLEAYLLGIIQGADFIEPDLVITQDGVLIARHENALATVLLDNNQEIIFDDNHQPIVTSETTNVAFLPQFRERLIIKTIDNKKIGGWFTEDFTAQEIRENILARERIPLIRPHNQKLNDQFVIPTLQEIINLVQKQSEKLGKKIGIYPEIKHPSYFQSLGLSIEESLIEIFNQYQLNHQNASVFIQSFEVTNLKKLKTLTDCPLIQLIGSHGQPFDLANTLSYDQMITPHGLAEIATYAAGIGVNKERIISQDQDGNLLSPTSLVKDAHDLNLLVHCYTFRRENQFLPANLKDHPEAEYQQYYQTEIDGVFSDNPDLAVQQLTLSPKPISNLMTI